MKKRIHLQVTALVFAALALLLLCCLVILKRTATELSKQSLKDTTTVLLSVLKADAPLTEEQFEAFAALHAHSVRITLIASDGLVLADSGGPAGDSADNHLEREEVAKAASGGFGISVRYSQTMRASYVYCAMAAELSDGMGGVRSVFLRTAAEEAHIDRAAGGFFAAAAAVAAALAAAAWLIASRITQNLLQPLTEIKSNLNRVVSGNYTYRFDITRYDEVNTVFQEIANVSDRLSGLLSIYQDEREKMEIILDNTSQGIIAVDENRRAVLQNAAARALFGEDIKLPAHISKLVRSPEILAAAEEAVEHGRMNVFDLRAEGGKLLGVEVVPVQSGAGINALILAGDVTALRKLETEKSEFFANASHELGTPLTSVLGYTELLREGRAEDKTGKFIEIVHAEALRMKSLVDDMLKLSKFESKHNAGENDKPQDFTRIVRAVLETFAAKAQAAGVEITQKLDNCTVTADREKLTELASNLIDNAIKYNVSGGRVDVLLEQTDALVRFTVRDTGIGIAPDYQHRVFERFFRVDKGRSRKVGGTGLGLAIVKHICAQYGAQLTLKSKEGGGTEITVSFRK